MVCADYTTDQPGDPLTHFLTQGWDYLTWYKFIRWDIFLIILIHDNIRLDLQSVKPLLHITYLIKVITTSEEYTDNIKACCCVSTGRQLNHLSPTLLHLHQQISGHGVIVTVGEFYNLKGLDWKKLKSLRGDLPVIPDISRTALNDTIYCSWIWIRLYCNYTKSNNWIKSFTKFWLIIFV